MIGIVIFRARVMADAMHDVLGAWTRARMSENEAKIMDGMRGEMGFTWQYELTKLKKMLQAVQKQGEEGEKAGEDVSSVASPAEMLTTLREEMASEGRTEKGIRAAGVYCTLLGTAGAGLYAFVDTAAVVFALGVVKKEIAYAAATTATMAMTAASGGRDSVAVGTDKANGGGGGRGGTKVHAGDGKRQKKNGHDRVDVDGGAGAENEGEDDIDASLAYATAMHCLAALRCFFARVGLKPELVKAAAPALAVLAPLELAAHAARELDDVSAANKKKRKAISTSSASGTQHRLASLDALEALVSAQDDDIGIGVVDSAATVLRSLAMHAILAKNVETTHAAALRKACLGVVDALVERHGATVEPAVSALMRHLCLCSPERMDERTHVLVGVGSMFQLLSDAEKVSFARFNFRLSKMKKPKHRLVAVDIASLLLRQLKEVDENLAAQETVPVAEDGDTEIRTEAAAAAAAAAAADIVDEDSAFNEFCVLAIGLLVQRASDRVNQIRGRALSNLADALSMGDVVPALKPILGRMCVAPVIKDTCPATTPRVHFALPGEDEDDENFVGNLDAQQQQQEQQQHTAAKSSVGPGASPLEVLAPAEDVFDVLCRRCKDESAAVRKASLLALERLLVSGIADARGVRIGAEAIAQGCLDALVTVRRQALNSLSALLDELPLSSVLTGLWVRGALPLSCDAEATVADRVAVWIKELVLDPLCDTAVAKKEHIACAYALLAEIDATPAAHLMLETCIERGAKQNVLDGQMTAAIQKLISESSTPAAGMWLLCSLLGYVFPKHLKWQELYGQWKACDAVAASAEADDENMRYVLGCVASAATNFSAKAASEIVESLHTKLVSLKLSPGLVGSHVKAFSKLTGHLGDAEIFNAAATSIYAGAAQYIGTLIKSGSSKMIASDAKRTTSVLFTASEMALYSTASVPDTLVTMVQALLADGQGSHDSDAVRGNIPTIVQAHAWVALGKLCFVDATLARTCLPLFVQQLGLSTTNAAVRNNIVIVLSDLCMKYTSLVDAYVGKIAAALGDECEIVRRQTLVLLSSLLHNDYVKWRGPLLHRILLCLVDESPAVREIAESAFGGGSSASSTNLAYNHFMESMMVLNGRWCDGSVGQEGVIVMTATAASIADDDTNMGTACALPGDANRGKRLGIYSALLVRMTQEQRIATSARVCSDVLGEFGESGKLSIEADVDLLFDALAVLQLPEAKPVSASSSSRSQDEAAATPFAEVDANSAQASAVAATRRRVVSELTRRSLSEVIVPCLVKLRGMLNAMRSPLVADVMAALCAQVSNRQKELPAILASDPLLLKEIQFDLREMERRHNAKFVRTPSASLVPALNEMMRSTGSNGTDGQKKDGKRATTSAPRSALKVSSAGAEATPRQLRDMTPGAAATKTAATPSSALRRMKNVSLHGVCPDATPAAARVLATSSPVFTGSMSSAERARLEACARTPATGTLSVPTLKTKLRSATPSRADDNREDNGDDDELVRPIPLEGLAIAAV